MKLYTKTVCSKCMLMKYELNKLGLDGKYEIINIEHDEVAKQTLLTAGFLTVPVFEMNGELIGDIEHIKTSISKMTV